MHRPPVASHVQEADDGQESERSTAGRIGVYLALVEGGAIVEIVTALDRVATTVITAVSLIRVDVAMWRLPVDLLSAPTQGHWVHK
jgi:hypothetical protein